MPTAIGIVVAVQPGSSRKMSEQLEVSLTTRDGMKEDGKLQLENQKILEESTISNHSKSEAVNKDDEKPLEKENSAEQPNTKTGNTVEEPSLNAESATTTNTTPSNAVVKASSATVMASTPPKKGAVVVKPSLRGTYILNDDGTGSWEGKWGMDDNAFEEGGIVSPFAYQSRPAGAKASNTLNVKNALLTGYFMMGSTTPGNPSTKHEEKDVLFEFTDSPDLPEKVLKVHGQGKNRFGFFDLDGTYNTETKELRCYRVYSPKHLKSRKPRQKRTRGSVGDRGEEISKSSGKRQRPGLTTPGVTEAPIVSRSSRIRRTPSHLIEDMDDDSDPMKKINNILLNLINNDKEGWFMTPVDAEALGLSTYHDIVKNPMDLGTIKKRLEENFYENEDQVIEDIRLTFNNACLFNPAGHPVNRVATQHLKIFENEIKRVLHSKNPKYKSGGKKKSVDGGGRRKRGGKGKQISMLDIDESSDEDESNDTFTEKRKKSGKRKSKVEDNAEMKVLRKQVEMMNKQLEMMQQMQEQNMYIHSMALNGGAQSISAPPAESQPRKKDMRPLSYQEKRQLGQDIHKLPGEMIQGVINIIQESGVSLGGDDEEVELDIEALDTSSLRKLQKYVRKCLSKARSKKLKEDIDSMTIG